MSQSMPCSGRPASFGLTRSLRCSISRPPWRASRPTRAARRHCHQCGWPGILCADTCEAGGLLVPELSTATKARLSTFLPSQASLGNPVDMIASASPDHYRQTIETLLPCDEIDVLVVIYIPVDTHSGRRSSTPFVPASRPDARRAVSASQCSLVDGGRGQQPSIAARSGECADLRLSETTARVLSKVADYAEWRARPMGMFLNSMTSMPRSPATPVVKPSHSAAAVGSVRRKLDKP